MSENTLTTPVWMWYDPKTMLVSGIVPLMSGQKLTLEGFNKLVQQGFYPSVPYVLGSDCLAMEKNPDEWLLIGIAPDLEAALAAQGAS